MNFKNLVNGCLTIMASSFLLVACSKQHDAVTPLTPNDETASVPVQSADTIKGRWANPAGGPAGFGTVYYNVATGAQDTVGSITYNLRFTSTNNTLINKATATSTDTLRFLNTTTALTSISLADYNSATAVTTLGQNTVSTDANTTLNSNGWWNYNSTTHVVSYTQNVVIFFRATGSANVYAFKFNNAWGEGGATLNRGVYSLRRGRVI